MGAVCGCTPGYGEWNAARMSLLARNESVNASRKPVIYPEIISAVDLFPRLATITQQWSQCADCDDTNPKWAEICRGILLCIKCCSVHRSLGTDVSKVRSITLDKWTQSMVDNMCESNEEFNAKWEFHVDRSYVKPTSNSSKHLRKKYIIAKYVGINQRDYKITNRLEPAFIHQPQLSPLPPIFDEINAAMDANTMENSYGMVLYSGVIEIYVMGATNLPKESDAYAVFRNSNGQSVKTKVIQNSTNPKWEEYLLLSVNEKEAIFIQIYDANLVVKDDLLCTSTLNVAKQCKNNQNIKFSMNMVVDGKFKKRNKQSIFTFTVKYDKMVVQ